MLQINDFCLNAAHPVIVTDNLKCFFLKNTIKSRWIEKITSKDIENMMFNDVFWLT